jgi:pimeloyl-ACP methyl ester carboxylesterase
MKQTLLALLTVISFSLYAQTDTVQGQYFKSDDVQLHYKVQGKGSDYLILLHGSLEAMQNWDRQINDLAKRYRVVTLDNRGHGKSGFTDRKMDYILLSEDVLNLMIHLKIDSAHIVGFGDGGIIGLRLASAHPEKVRKLVAIGANYKVDTSVVYHEVLDKVKEWDENKIYQYMRNNFRGYKNFSMIKQFTERMKTMLLTEPNMTIADLQKIKCPTLFITGDHDIIKLSHTSEMYENVQQGYLSVISGTKHYPQKEKPELVNAIILEFLNKKFIKLLRF